MDDHGNSRDHLAIISIQYMLQDPLQTQHPQHLFKTSILCGTDTPKSLTLCGPDTSKSSTLSRPDLPLARLPGCAFPSLCSIVSKPWVDNQTTKLTRQVRVHRRPGLLRLRKWSVGRSRLRHDYSRSVGASLGPWRWLIIVELHPIIAADIDSTRAPRQDEQICVLGLVHVSFVVRFSLAKSYLR
jgi:hypothetical protein